MSSTSKILIGIGTLVIVGALSAVTYYFVLGDINDRQTTTTAPKTSQEKEIDDITAEIDATDDLDTSDLDETTAELDSVNQDLQGI